MAHALSSSQAAVSAAQIFKCLIFMGSLGCRHFFSENGFNALQGKNGSVRPSEEFFRAQISEDGNQY